MGMELRGGDRGGDLGGFVSPFDRERELASAAVFGSARHSTRGANAQLEQNGLGGIPGVQSAVASQAREQNLTALGGMYNNIGEREQRYIGMQNALAEARRRERDAADQATREKWGAIAEKLVGAIAMAGITLATGGTGTAALLAGGSSLFGGGVSGGGQQPQQQPQPPSYQTPDMKPSYLGFSGGAKQPNLGGIGTQSYVNPYVRNYQQGDYNGG